MKPFEALLTGTGLGLLAMYVFDPEVGRRRRALARDQMTRLQRKTREAAGVTARDLKNRTLGLVAEGRSYFSEGDIGDDVLAERVRAKLGFLVRHPSAIEAQVVEGRAILRGPVLSDEVQQLIAGIRSVRGVRDVENQLEVHDEPNNIPALQGDQPKPTGEPIDILQQRWSPSTRFLVGLGGLFLLLSTGRNEKTPGTLAALGGLAALACSSMNGEKIGEPESAGRGAQDDVISGWS
ncbi:MAG: BON domain-containing protein [Candidatus Binatia bacterium]